MAVRLKTWHPDVTLCGAKVGADEVDFYHVYRVMFPSIDATAIATAEAIATGAALVENVTTLGYPRNLLVTCAGGTTDGTYGGTVVINGLNQFGQAIQETFSIATAVNGGIAVGTKVFATFVSGTATLAGDTAVATCNVGVGTAGTTTLFGLPFKVGGTKDLLNYSWGSAGASKFVPSSSLGSYVSTTQHAILARTDFVGTSGFVAWFKSTKDQNQDLTDVVGR
jgi:hypothetical protein